MNILEFDKIDFSDYTDEISKLCVYKYYNSEYKYNFLIGFKKINPKINGYDYIYFIKIFSDKTQTIKKFEICLPNLPNLHIEKETVWNINLWQNAELINTKKENVIKKMCYIFYIDTSIKNELTIIGNIFNKNGTILFNDETEPHKISKFISNNIINIIIPNKYSEINKIKYKSINFESDYFII